ncbi:response regulator transcription factor [Dechloromonas sp. XY25]|uniref:Response regulator transcription factor n=1 Tax=Dechloromonas hankyongensis TaxID=2908002 RepID=A0ABS9K475_9RHOO|nr:response regulator transcription factor [Dechloromonas hankyongensis]MCG2577960.1 response regulator transcription factor [Dechloromonas hankyongensis]
MKALVLEDASVALTALRSLLDRLPEVQEVRVAELIADAKQICRSFSPDLAVLDVLLPDGNGMELIHTIRSVNPKARIVVLSYYANVHGSQALRAGADMFLDKSAGFDAMGQSLSAWVAQLARTERQSI